MNLKTKAMVAMLREDLEKKMSGREIKGGSVDIPTRSGARHALVYRPSSSQAADAAGALPVYFDVHGGGFVYGCPEMDDELNHRISEELEIVVVSPSYRLAPEFPYPSDKEDVLDAITYVHDHAAAWGVDPARMAVGGHSAGGNITAVMCLMAKESGSPRFRCAILDYPPVDFKTSAFDKETPEGCIPPKVAAAFDECYLDPARVGDAHLSPLYATPDELEGLPPHAIITAEGDSLRGEAEEYARHLAAAGVDVTCRRFPGVSHGFTLASLANSPSGDAEVAAASKEAAIQMMIDTLRKHLL